MLTFANGDREEGQFRNGVLHGHGTYNSANGFRYEGQFRNGGFHGRGVTTWPNGDHYEGDFRDGERTGRGTYTWPNGDRYGGDWRNGKQHGQGVFTSADGKRWSGNYVNGQRGRGTWTQATGSTGGSGAPSTAASGGGSANGVKGATAQNDLADELCREAHAAFSPEAAIASTWSDNNKRQLALVVTGMNYRDQLDCVEVIEDPRTSALRNKCNYPVITGACISKVGPIGTQSPGRGRQKPPPANELCDPKEPRPALDSGYPPLRFLPPWPHDTWPGSSTQVEGWITDSYLYWAFTCEP